MKKRIFYPVSLLLFFACSIVFAQTIDHVVAPGDTLSGIAAKYFGDARLWPELLKYNNIADPHWIYTGDVIKVPSEEVLKSIRNAKTEEEKQKIINDSKYGNYVPPAGGEGSGEVSSQTSENNSNSLLASTSNEIRQAPPAVEKPTIVYRLSDLRGVLQKYRIKEKAARPRVQ